MDVLKRNENTLFIFTVTNVDECAIFIFFFFFMSTSVSTVTVLSHIRWLQDGIWLLKNSLHWSLKGKDFRKGPENSAVVHKESS